MRDKLGLPTRLRLPDDSVNAHKNPASLNRKLSPEGKQNLESWYKKDYDFISICKEFRAAKGEAVANIN